MLETSNYIALLKSFVEKPNLWSKCRDALLSTLNTKIRGFVLHMHGKWAEAHLSLYMDGSSTVCDSPHLPLPPVICLRFIHFFDNDPWPICRIPLQLSRPTAGVCKGEIRRYIPSSCEHRSLFPAPDGAAA